MTKPKGMSDAEWKEKRRAARARPEEKVKNAARMKERYHDNKTDPAFKARLSKNNKNWVSKTGYSKKPDVKAKNTKRMVEKYHTDAAHAETVKASHRERYVTDEQYREARKSYERNRNHGRRLNEEFDAYMARIGMEDAQHAQQDK